MGVFTAEEVDARQNIMLDEYSNVLAIEAETALNMTNQLFLPALAEDLNKYTGAAAALSGDRASTYAAVVTASAALKTAVQGAPKDGASEQELADHFAYSVKPKLAELRAAVDAAEVLCSSWPVPSYIDLLFHHQSDDVNFVN
jgi:glutamine synthetase